MPALSRRRKQLEEELLALGDDTMLIEVLDGFIAGLLVCPELISPGEWLRIVFSRDEENPQSAFADIDHANRVFGLVMDHYNDVVLTLMDRPESYRPLFSIDGRNGDVLWEIWIEGFLEAVNLRPAAWQSLLDANEDTATAMEGMLKLANFVAGEHDLTSEEVDTVRNSAPALIPGWVVTLNNWRLSKTKPASVVTQTPRPSFAPRGKVGRNEPCPCGSGKKYKKCCGLN